MEAQLIFSSKCWGFIPGFDVRAFIPQRLSRSPEYFEFVNNVLNLIICESLKETGGMTSYTACTICTQWSWPTAQAGRSWDYLLTMFQDEYPGDFASLINLIPERKPRIAEDQKKKHRVIVRFVSYINQNATVGYFFRLSKPS